LVEALVALAAVQGAHPADSEGVAGVVGVLRKEDYSVGGGEGVAAAEGEVGGWDAKP
jgi:hypothetical protein